MGKEASFCSLCMRDEREGKGWNPPAPSPVAGAGGVRGSDSNRLPLR